MSGFERPQEVIPTTERSRRPVAFIAGLVIVTLLIALPCYQQILHALRRNRNKTAGHGLTEQTYAPQIHFSDPKMSRAANFLNQESPLS